MITTPCGGLGAAYARVALGCAAPRVALLSVGEEESKGNDLTREAHQLLKHAPVHFVGNVEGREVFAGEADVIVCDVPDHRWLGYAFGWNPVRTVIAGGALLG